MEDSEAETSLMIPVGTPEEEEPDLPADIQVEDSEAETSHMIPVGTPGEEEQDLPADIQMEDPEAETSPKAPVGTPKKEEPDLPADMQMEDSEAETSPKVPAKRNKTRLIKNYGVPPKKTHKRLINTTGHERRIRPSGRKESKPVPAIRRELTAAKRWASKAFLNIASRERLDLAEQWTRRMLECIKEIGTNIPDILWIILIVIAFYTPNCINMLPVWSEKILTAPSYLP